MQNSSSLTYTRMSKFTSASRHPRRVFRCSTFNVHSKRLSVQVSPRILLLSFISIASGF